MNKSVCFVFLLLLCQCTNSIKDKNAKVVIEPGTKTLLDQLTQPVDSLPDDHLDFQGFWVGYFLKDDGSIDKNIYVDEAFIWERENKINIAIDRTEGENVFGHSVVAGNYRPFTGTFKDKDGSYYFEVKEPGDNQYDGAFSFHIDDTALIGKWQAYQKIDVPKRKYILQKKEFKYDPDRKLDVVRPFVNYTKSKKHYDKEMDEYYQNFSTTTDKIYKLNASNKLLDKKDVHNLKKGDILIIRNTIYARHGYSFKNRPLRIFFDSQEWYIPIFSDIKVELTEIEKKNIALLLLYEKNAKEYYDYFGRG
jgi:hypothetical protein